MLVNSSLAFMEASGMPVGISLVVLRFRNQHLLRTSKVLSDAVVTEDCGKL